MGEGGSCADKDQLEAANNQMAVRRLRPTEIDFMRENCFFGLRGQAK